ncbi:MULTISPECIES: DUF3305 domain-containing protein [unclassified Bradyrhizobium]|uniref:DUF3305 domain-containing protein n=1 Tax=unclassified Bradyrhizobium TaxID=2631580 RepID=UPI00211ECF97|nr:MULTISPECIES: DUF3305 domain-containing protein [unclassified Bradyrhizobium]MDD1533182.1 DUF3305 domain-containing protein [Bradyrhizobium sp. WBOS8]MDD1582836.1 DUF3305 domain-containing protein [Bradyrhizobium sp. WBOS4]UUO48308.1 DUF3305 domain-containing protein [Bradyrhizobium sp. WBOS04]UUO61929.1 DUF3305 domain-containing protein [Bradyrhizobium sp. WBOS08]
MSPAALPTLSIPVGVVVERRKAASPWVDFVWRGIAVLPDEPTTRPWTVLREQDDTTLFYAGSAAIELYPSETARYRDNLASGNPSLWTVLSPSEGVFPYAVAAVTADPAEGEGFTEAADNLVEAVPMPEALLETIEKFVAEHHVEREFVKRKRRRADPEALARREPEGGQE